MKYLIPLLASFFFLSCDEKNTDSVSYPGKKNGPTATIKPHELTIHGNTRVDNYYWMNERDSPEVLAHLNKENAYTKE